jgi:hypothetical protein
MGWAKKSEKIQAEILIKAQTRSFSGPIRTAHFMLKNIRLNNIILVLLFGREGHSSIPTIAIGRGLKPLDARTDPRTRFNWW